MVSRRACPAVTAAAAVGATAPSLNIRGLPETVREVTPGWPAAAANDSNDWQ
jgi:hypothetical protein